MAMAATRKALLPRVELVQLCPPPWSLCANRGCYVHTVPFSDLFACAKKSPKVAKNAGPALQRLDDKTPRALDAAQQAL